MRRRAIIGLGLSCLAAACAHQGGPEAPGMAWSLQHAEGEGAKLAFGQPSSDNVLLMMTCQPRSGQVLVSVTTGEVSDAIELSSKEHVSRLSGQAVPAMGEGSVLMEAEAGADDRTLASFARTGELAVVENGRRSALPVRAAERETVSRFFAECRAA
jgi:hypothetical protein